jgi:hypothetical protein
MKTGELLEKHPLATEVIRTWFFDQMVASFADESVPEEFKEMMKQEGVTNERLATLIDVQPRTLFDVFDENDIFINIIKEDSTKFMWGYVDTTGNYIKDSLVKTRKEAEITAIEKAFELLEIKLTPIELPELEEN